MASTIRVLGLMPEYNCSPESTHAKASSRGSGSSGHLHRTRDAHAAPPTASNLELAHHVQPLRSHAFAPFKAPTMQPANISPPDAAKSHVVGV